jgi:hypothetical protein
MAIAQSIPSSAASNNQKCKNPLRGSSSLSPTPKKRKSTTLHGKWVPPLQANVSETDGQQECMMDDNPEQRNRKAEMSPAASNNENCKNPLHGSSFLSPTPKKRKSTTMHGKWVPPMQANVSETDGQQECMTDDNPEQRNRKAEMRIHNGPEDALGNHQETGLLQKKNAYPCTQNKRKLINEEHDAVSKNNRYGKSEIAKLSDDGCDGIEWVKLINQKHVTHHANEIPADNCWNFFTKSDNNGNHSREANRFIPFPNCSGLCYFNPPTHDEKRSNEPLAEFISVLEMLPSMICKFIPQDKMHKLHEKHCLENPDETKRSLVIIDGCRFEFYIPNDKNDSNSSSLVFDTHIMGPMLSTWSKSKFSYLKTPQDFKTMLLKYLSRCYDQSFKIHAISFIFDYPNSSPVRQWSHIDGSKGMFQGTISCGDGSSVTLEFPCLDTKITMATELQKVWTFLPTENNVISAICKDPFCTHLLEHYGTLLNHAANAPLNPISYQNMLAKQCPNVRVTNNSPISAGTIFRMPGNTIHAGPESDKHNGRAIFFMQQVLPGHHYMTQRHNGTK